MYAKQLDKNNGNQASTKIKNFLETVYGSPKSVTSKHGDFVIKWVPQATTITSYSNATDQ